MMRQGRIRVEAYTYLAQVYDALMYDVDTNVWAEYLDELLKRSGANKVLDVACGTREHHARTRAAGL